MRDTLLGTIWRAFRATSEAAVTVGFRSTILDLYQLREEQAGELLFTQEALAQAREDHDTLEKSLVFLTNAHAEERALRQKLSDEVGPLQQALEREKAAHSHAIQKFMSEAAQRTSVQVALTDERTAKERAVFLQKSADAKQKELQVRKG